MTKRSKPERIKRVELSGLFGRFQHVINFKENDDIVVITAPNGYGKTIVLRAINALFRRDFRFFKNLSFSTFEVTLYSKLKITITSESANLPLEDEPNDKVLTLWITDPTGKSTSFPLSELIKPVKLGSLERLLPIERIARDRWFDYSRSSELSVEEVVDLYGDRFPERLLRSLESPEPVVEASKLIRTHLVETQRLLSLEEYDKNSRPYSSPNPKPSSVVEKDATDLSKKISSVIQQYASEAQELDQSFPKRIIELRRQRAPSNEEIKIKLDEIAKSRDKLVDVGLISKTLTEPIKPSENFDDEQVRRVLAVYADDTEKKLNVFTEIFEKISLFREIINDYFSFKKIIIDPEDGMRAVDEQTGKPISLDDLSSGEQHELVLIYELLFKVPEGAVILIDEPELSLHVAWQVRFIRDIQKIQKLRRLNVVIATHSPQIINDRWDLVQELGK